MLGDIESASSYDEFLDLLGDVRIARGLSCEHLDHLIGLTKGHTNKILSPRREKGLSPAVLDGFLTSLAIRLTVVEDPEALARMQGRWEHRDETNVRKRGWRVSRRLLNRARPVVLQELIDAATAARDGQSAA
jgi:hypothetical protein